MPGRRTGETKPQGRKKRAKGQATAGSPPLRSDLGRIRAAFAARNKGKLIALANVGQTRINGWDQVFEELHERKLSKTTASALFWHGQEHARAFDPSGKLVEPLVLYWAGDKALLAAALRGIEGFDVRVPPSERHGFELWTAGTLPPPAEF